MLHIKHTFEVVEHVVALTAILMVNNLVAVEVPTQVRFNGQNVLMHVALGVRPGVANTQLFTVPRPSGYYPWMCRVYSLHTNTVQVQANRCSGKPTRRCDLRYGSPGLGQVHDYRASHIRQQATGVFGDTEAAHVGEYQFLGYSVLVGHLCGGS